MTDFEVIRRANDRAQGVEIQAIFVIEAYRRARRIGISFKASTLQNKRHAQLGYGIDEALSGQLVRFFN